MRKAFKDISVINHCLMPEFGPYNYFDLCEAFLAIHKEYRITYKQIHQKFLEELKERKDIHIHSTSDIFVRGVERRRMPIVENRWISHISKI